MKIPNNKAIFLHSLPQPYPISLTPSFIAENHRKKRPLIKPIFHKTLQNYDYTSYVSFIEEAIESIIPPHILSEIKNGKSYSSVSKALTQLNNILPVITWSEPQTTPSALCFSLLCPGAFTHGVGRYVSDVLSRWLIPGKCFGLLAVHSLNFQFDVCEQHNYFVHQVILEVEDDKQLALIKNNIPSLIQEIRLNIMAVKHARSVMATKKLSFQQKTALIQENLASILDRPSKEFDHNIFDQMHHFLIKLSAEEKISQINERFSPYIEHKPKVFDRDIYNEIQNFIRLFRDRFTAIRDLKHVGRLISFQYLFRKALQQEIKNAPKERHLFLKLLRTTVDNKKVLGLLLGINVLRENELFEERHIHTAIQHCLGGVRINKDSYLVDHRSHDKVRLYYLEIEKENLSTFSLDDVKQLRKWLPRELKAQFENVIHPVFMPRNEEEVMRNIVLLSQQLKYIRDMPQAVISFDAQTEEQLSFTVVLLRLLGQKDPSLKTLFLQAKAALKLHDLEVKHVGRLRKKYVKEASVFTVRLDKRPFLRKDYSLDLFKARQSVYTELSSILGEIRDFNGGILSKQNEVFNELRQSLLETHQNHDFLLENFFYSLTPSLMRSILPPNLLKSLFLMLLETLENPFQEQLFSLKSHAESGYLMVMAGSMHPTFKEELLTAVNHLKIPTSQLTCCFVNEYEIDCIGYIYRCEEQHERTAFFNAIKETLMTWEKLGI